MEMIDNDIDISYDEANSDLEWINILWLRFHIMKNPPYIYACFSILKDRKSRQKHMADPLKCKNVLLNMCQNLLAALHSNFLCTHIK